MLDSSSVPPGQGGFPVASNRFIMTAIRHLLRHARLALGVCALTSQMGLAGFSYIYVFGDGVSNTNNVPTGSALNYYENRYCNGKVFVEVLSGWQGVTFDPTKNVSNFENDSFTLLASITSLNLSALTPQQRADSLFIIWVNNADYVNFTGVEPLPWTSPVPWSEMASDSILNHETAIASLYEKGARKIVMPNAVDIMNVPLFNAFRISNPTDSALARQRIIAYNQQFKTAMNGAMVGKPGLQIILPDTFAFFEQVLANPGAFGMVNFNDLNAGGIDSEDPALNGAGAQYVFWDDYHPTAKFQIHLAAFIQQCISPIKVNSISRSSVSVQMQLANVPLGRVGSILGSPDLQPPWVQDVSINEPFVEGGSTTKTYTFPANGSKRFYRAAFPVVWTWP